MRPTRSYFTDLTGAISADLYRRVSGELRDALDECAVRRDLEIPETGSTPRRYSVATRETIATRCPAAAALYRSAELLSLVSAAAGEPVAPVPYQPEEFIATRLERAGDTHGWHWDDYRYALVWILEAPPVEAGGGLELIPGVPWNKRAPGVATILQSRAVECRAVRTGMLYLLDAATTMHRVAPLERDATRIALCFSYAGTSDLARPVSHETVERIYGRPAPAALR